MHSYSLIRDNFIFFSLNLQVLGVKSIGVKAFNCLWDLQVPYPAPVALNQTLGVLQFWMCHEVTISSLCTLTDKHLPIPFLRAHENLILREFFSPPLSFKGSIKMLTSLQIIYKREFFSAFKECHETLFFINTVLLPLYFYVSLILVLHFAILCVTTVSNDTLRYWVPAAADAGSI